MHTQRYTWQKQQQQNNNVATSFTCSFALAQQRKFKFSFSFSSCVWFCQAHECRKLFLSLHNAHNKHRYFMDSFSSNCKWISFTCSRSCVFVCVCVYVITNLCLFIIILRFLFVWRLWWEMFRECQHRFSNRKKSHTKMQEREKNYKNCCRFEPKSNWKLKWNLS